MKGFISKLQKDLNRLQRSVMKESEDLLAKLEKYAKSSTTGSKVLEKRDEIEKLIDSKRKSFQPALDNFLHDVKKSAEKYGFDLDGVESKVRSSTKKAKTKLKKTTARSKKKATKVVKATKTAKKTAKKKAAKKVAKSATKAK